MTTRHVDVLGGRLLVVDGGSGPPIALLHAGIAAHRAWNEMVPLEANAPNARAVVWPDVAHMIGMEQPERLAATIVEFLAPLERWS